MVLVLSPDHHYGHLLPAHKEARGIFTKLGAKPFLEKRLDQARRAREDVNCLNLCAGKLASNDGGRFFGHIVASSPSRWGSGTAHYKLA